MSIADINDRVRRNLSCRVIFTHGVQQLDSTKVLDAVTQYDDFNAGIDPHFEHDMGSFEVDDSELYFKIDYYDLTYKHGSEDPSDESITNRVLTIMLRSEY